MTINTDQTLALLQASNYLGKEIAELRKENAELKADNAFKEQQITTLQCRLMRASIPFAKREAV